MGIGGTGLKTVAVIESDDEYTRIVAKKRESDDLLVNGFQEVYSSESGEYLGGFADETVKLLDFETYWFNLYDVTGFDSVRIVDERNPDNDLNADTVFINGSAVSFAVKDMSIINFSRRYDVEMKVVYYVREFEDNGKTKYETVKTEIPMLCVQKSVYSSLGKDIKDNNPDSFDERPSVEAGLNTVAESSFSEMLALFDTITSIAYEDIIGYINGNQN